MDLAQFWFQAAGGGSYEIGNSLRFRGAQYLQRTVGTAGDRKKWTWSGWFKRATLGQFGGGGDYMPFSIVGSTGGGNYDVPFYLAYNTQNDQPFWYLGTNGTYESKASMKLRDVGGWYHAVCVLDTDNATANLRWRTWVNGVEITSFDSRSTVSQGYSGGYINNNINHYIGWTGATGQQFIDGYMAECHFVDGQALAPTDFGEYNDDGVWVPKNFTGTHGSNGFYLDFSDPSNIGADRSGNGNNWTATGFDLTNTSSTSYDWMADSPTINTATANPLITGLATNYFDANLRVQGVGLPAGSYPTIQIPNDANTPYYLEIELTSVGSGGNQAHIAVGDIYFAKDLSSGSFVYYRDDGVINGTGGYAPFANGDIIGIVVQPSANTVAFYHNGSNQLDITGVNFSTNWVIYGFQPQAGNPVWYWNLGQQPWRASFVPPGVQSISTAQLPDVAITNPSDHFSTILDTGANILTAAQAKFSNGLWWIKDRANSNQHQLVDSVRGGNLALTSPTVSNETAYVAPAGNSVAWCWNADSAAVANTDGTIPSQVSANQAAGFSIVTYTGDGNTSATVGHGLGAEPKLTFIKKRLNPSGTGSNFVVYHASMGAGSAMFLNSVSPQSGGYFPTAPTSTVFQPSGAGSETNWNGDSYVAYCWAEVPSYSSFGSYVGNGSNDGPFCYTGFRPAFVMYKRTDAAGSWQMFDSARATYNPAEGLISAEDPGAEFFNSTFAIDFLSNGFKFRGFNTGSINAAGSTNIYIAFAEHPMGGSNISPAPAR